jgi:hypothetical protein
MHPEAASRPVILFEVKILKGQGLENDGATAEKNTDLQSRLRSVLSQTFFAS